jgi:hypothetical protein
MINGRGLSRAALPRALLVTRVDIASGHPVTDAPTDIDEDLDLKARITFARDSPADAQQRQVIARIDGGPASTLMFGDRITIEVEPGTHVLRANNTLFWKRVRFSIEAGEHLQFQFVNRSGRFTLSLLALLGVAPLYLDIERTSIR